MQEQHNDGLVSPVMPFSEKAAEDALNDPHVESVEVFKEGSKAHEKAKLDWSRLTKNQKRRIRQRLKKRGLPGGKS